MSHTPVGLPSLLTPREYEVAELIADGLSNQQIAERLVLTPGTVANHVAHVLAKLQLESRVHVAVEVVRHQSRAESSSVLDLLERLREVRRASLPAALQHAADVLAATFAADKVDAFLVDAQRSQLVAVGTSRTPMGQRQRELGLHQLPLSSGGRAAWVFHEQRPFLNGHLETDERELPSVRHVLGVRSTMAVPLEVNHCCRGVLQVASATPEQFSQTQLHLLQFVAYWVGLVADEQEPEDAGDRPG
jgi:DNA-binding CsgD family transcriptional regulator